MSLKMKFLVPLMLILLQHASASFQFLHHRSYDKEDYADIEDRSLICKLDAVLLACKVLGAQATTFCSGYLHISSTTVIVTSKHPRYVDLYN